MSPTPVTLQSAHCQGRGSLTRVPSLGMRLDCSTLPSSGFREPRRARDEDGARPRRGERVPRGGWRGASWEPGGWKAQGSHWQDSTAPIPDLGMGQGAPLGKQGLWDQPCSWDREGNRVGFTHTFCFPNALLNGSWILPATPRVCAYHRVSYSPN